MFLVERNSTNSSQAEPKSIDQQIKNRLSYYRLSADDKLLVNELRSKVKDQLSPRYDTDFNLYRWIKHAELLSKQKADIDSVSRSLRNHLRYRLSLNLDSDRGRNLRSWDENPLFTKGILPRGQLQYMPSNNRFLWWVDYSEINVEGIVNTFSSKDLVVWHFWMYEYILKLVNEKEQETGALSGACMITDVKNLCLTPGFMLSANNGHMSYTAQLLYYDQYPELSSPVHMINVSKLLMLPYRVVRVFMPHDFTEKFRMCDSNYKQALLKIMTEDELPKQLGGRNPDSDRLGTIHPQKFDPSNYYQQRRLREGLDQEPDSDHLFHFQVSARKRKMFSIFCSKGSALKWWFKADGELYFGIYFVKNAEADFCSENNQNEKIDVLDKMEMVHPKFLALTKYIPEICQHQCDQSGTYYLVFCNKTSWLYRRNVHLKLEIDGKVKKDLTEAIVHP